MKIRSLAVAGVVTLSVAALAVAGCSDSNKDNSSSSTTVKGGGIGGNVTAPVILNPNNTSATVKVGQIVTFDMGQPASGGSFVATSDNTKVFEVTSEGKSVGTSTQNAGGKAVGTGTAKVTVVFKGSMNGMGTPTTFTITVQ
ncbi:MAG: hypothetical protein ACKOIA_00160 [Acidimicrobiia bacterium]